MKARGSRRRLGSVRTRWVFDRVRAVLDRGDDEFRRVEEDFLLLGMVLTLRYRDGLSYPRIIERCREHGLSVTVSQAQYMLRRYGAPGGVEVGEG